MLHYYGAGVVCVHFAVREGSFGHGVSPKRFFFRVWQQVCVSLSCARDRTIAAVPAVLRPVDDDTKSLPLL